MAAERKLKETEPKLQLSPVGIFTVGQDEKETHYLILSDPFDNFTVTKTTTDKINEIKQEEGDDIHISLPNADPEKVNFVQIGHDSQEAIELERTVGVDSEVKIAIQGKDMSNGSEQKIFFTEKEFSELFLEPPERDSLDFYELQPVNGHVDFAIFAHDEDDPTKVTIFSIAEPAEPAENGVARTTPKTDLLQFIEETHHMIVGTGAPDFAHYKEQDELEHTINEAFAHGEIQIAGSEHITTYDDLPRDAKILFMIYKTQVQFALRGSKRYNDEKYYEQKLKELAPFYKQSWWEKLWAENEQITINQGKWQELLSDHSHTDLHVEIQAPKQEPTAWRNKWDKDLPLDEIGRLENHEQNEYVANTAYRLLERLSNVDYTRVGQRTRDDLVNVVSQLHGTLSRIHQSRSTAVRYTSDPELDYPHTQEVYSIGSFDCAPLMRFLNEDEFTVDISKKSRQEIVDYTINRWEKILLKIKSNKIAMNRLQTYDSLTYLAGGYFPSTNEGDPGKVQSQAKELSDAFEDLLMNLPTNEQHESFSPYHLAETIMLSKVIFAFVADFQQLEYRKELKYKYDVWAQDFKDSLDTVFAKRK